MKKDLKEIYILKKIKSLNNLLFKYSKFFSLNKINKKIESIKTTLKSGKKEPDIRSAGKKIIKRLAIKLIEIPIGSVYFFFPLQT